MKGKRVFKAENLSSDIISTLPQTVLEAILSLLPTKEAARTSIVSSEWRYKWTNIPKLDFRLSDVSKRVTNEMQVQGIDPFDWKHTVFYDLHQILLLHQCSINEFTLHMDVLAKITYGIFGFDEILLHLSKYHKLKKLSLSASYDSDRYNLPVSIFSLHHLTDLEISSFCISHQPTFNGFGSLTRLVLRYVVIRTKVLFHLLSNCPSLKVLSMILLVHDKDSTIMELFKSLPLIEHLTTWHHILPWLILDRVPKELSTSLFHLKYFCLKETCLHDRFGLPFLLLLIKCSPNLKKLKIEIACLVDEENYVVWKEYSKVDEENYVVWKEYSDVWLEHLVELEIRGFNNLKPEMEFVKFILARSSKLKNVKINVFIPSVVDWHADSEMLKTLLQAPRASPVIITVDHGY